MANVSGRVVAVVQARMGSSRLPGKVLLDIGGRTMLERVVRRLQGSRGLDEVVVATSTLAADDSIVGACSTLDVRVVRGDPLDVLARYALAASDTDAEVMVRITADCPFVDPDVVAAVVGAFRAGPSPADYASNTIDPRTFPRGLDVEVFTAQALMEADRQDDDPGSREHVTPFIRDSGRYRLVAVAHDEDLSSIRWTVDTEEDLDVARRLSQAVGDRIDVSWLELLATWREHPEWHSINSHIEQKKVQRELG